MRNADEQIWDYCEFCGCTITGIFCSCTKSKESFYHEETKREILNDLYQSLNTHNVELKVENVKWA